MVKLNDQAEIIEGAVRMQSLAAPAPREPDAPPIDPSGHDPMVIAAAKKFLEEGSLSNGARPNQTWLANATGFTPAVISSWLGGKYKGDVAKVNRFVADCLKTVKMRVADGTLLFHSPVTREVKGAFEQTIKNGCVTVLIGESGIGKTCGRMLYQNDHPTAVGITLYDRLGGNAGSIQRSMMSQIDSSRYSTRRGMTRGDFLREHFRGSDRLIIIDNGELLTRSGLQFIIYFNDATETPICIIGTPDLLKRVRSDDKLFSRVGLNPIIPFDEPRSFALKMLNQHCPEHTDDLLDLALQVVENRGRGRSLKKTLKHALYLFSKGVYKNVSQAFRAAHKEMVRDYDLKS